MFKAFIADRIFTGNEWLTDHAVIINDGIIQEIIPGESLPANMVGEKFPAAFISPAFIDLQIYGAYGKLLAVYPETDSLSLLRDYCAKGGAAFCLPTLATNTKDVFYKSIDAVKQYWKEDGPGILGLHLEGPWINPIKKGAHIASCIHSPSSDQVQELLDYGSGVIKMITLAPEVCSKEIIELILSHNIIISAGHSNATYQEANTGFANGITTVTHLYNAMSPLQHRAPGLAGATMDHTKAMASIIPDGHHVDYAAIRIAKQIMKERLFVITDAVTTTDVGFYPHKEVGDKYEAAGILSGSALTMIKAVQNLVNHTSIPLSEALRMCSLYPAQAIKKENELGKIEKGYKASMVVIDNQMNVLQLI